VFKLVLTGSAAINASLGQGACEKINALIAEHNKYTDNFTHEVSHARKALEKDEVAKVLRDYSARRKAITDAETGLAAVQRATQDIQRQIATLEQVIRNRRKSADELNKEMAAYLGHNELQFEIRETGYTITRNGQPAMHLSEGERTAIAFMYFLKSLSDADFDLKRGIIVIDDPVSSLDTNALYSAFAFMKAHIPKPKEFDGQLFVLTHNFKFFQQVKNWFNHIEDPSGRRSDPAKSKLVRFYMLKSPTINGQRNAQICLLNHLLHEYESEYHYMFSAVHEVAYNQANAPLSDYYGLPNIGRRLLETVLAFKRPERSGELYQQLLAVEGFDEAKKARIIRFTNTYSHNGQINEPEHDLSLLVETPYILRDILALIEHIDPEHFRGMAGLIAPSATSRDWETAEPWSTGERCMTFNAQRALDLLRLGSGLPNASFREGQEEAIRHIVEGRGRLLVVQKTGWGKSFIYFIATKLLREAGGSPTLLISPLLALMRNQIAAAERTGLRAVTINSDNQDEWANVEAALARNEVDILLISPERLANERFRTQVLAGIAGHIALLVIDEAHCISDWGHDFRPHYRLLERVVRTLPANLRLLATTATANNRVMDDLRTVLGPSLDVLRGDLNRPALALQTIRLPSQAERLAWLAAQVAALPGHGIIYTLTVRDAAQVAEWLASRGLNVASYTGETGEGRVALEQALLENRVKALVATTALGMDLINRIWPS
jgi:AAA domain/DEAD/DEAH box helicase